MTWDPQTNADRVLQVGAVVPYVKKSAASNAEALKQRDLLFALKNGRSFVYDNKSHDPAKIYAQFVKPSALDVLGPEVVLVPLPRSTRPDVLPPPANLWASRWLAEALVAENHGSRVHFGLERTSTIRKASECASSERPTVREHMATLRADVSSLRSGDAVVLVDDLITRGTQMMAAAEVLRLARPDLEIRGFAASYYSFGNHLGEGENITCRVTWRVSSDVPRCVYPT